MFSGVLYPLNPRLPFQEHMPAVRLDPRLILVPRRTHVNCDDDGHPPQPDIVRIATRLAISERVDVVVRLEQSPVVQNKLHVVHVVETSTS